MCTITAQLLSDCSADGVHAYVIEGSADWLIMKALVLSSDT